MSDSPTDPSGGVNRRDFLRVSGASVAGATLLDMLAARRAPAQIKGTTLRIIMWSHFVPAYDMWLDDWSQQWGNANGVNVRLDHIPQLELPARYAAEFAAGTGHDLIYFAGSDPDRASTTRTWWTSPTSRTRSARSSAAGSTAPRSSPQVQGAWYAIPDFYISHPDALAEGPLRRRSA